MIAVFYGEDGFSADEAFETLRVQLDNDGQLVDNTDRVDGPSAKPDELLLLCRTLPFLSARRLVVVRGLLRRFESSGRRGRRKDRGLGAWEPFVDGLRELPETTALVFMDEKLSPTNPMLKEVGKIAEVRQFTPLKQNEVANWITARAQKLGIPLEARATAALAGLVGPNLRLLDSELRKLRMYAGERPVSEDDVRALVSMAREPSVFAWADAVAEGRTKEASEQLQRLLAEGEAPQYLLVMLARQYRLLLLTKEAQARRMRAPEIAAKLGVPPFVAQKVLKQAPAHNVDGLRRDYRRLLEADLSIKRGVYNDVTALELLAIELANAARPRASA